MLKLAQVSRQPLRIAVVDLSAMAAAAIAKLRAAEPGRCVEFVSAAGLMVRADAALVAILIDNLFANAWKFTRKRDRARIEFDRDERGWFCVRDNGVGFDPAQAERIFSGFTRLHSSGEYEGSGIGLATVRRICERHGGDITCDAAVDRGATFRFALGRH
jgi:signal transduction histidine kinase